MRIPRVDGILEIMIIVQRGETLWNIKENRCQSGWMILFVLEFKVAKKVKDLEKMADEALRQIAEKQYAAELYELWNRILWEGLSGKISGIEGV